MKQMYFLLALSLCSSFAFATDTEIALEEPDSFCDGLRPLCENYKSSLKLVYACEISRQFHRLLSTATAENELRKSQELDILLANLDQWSVTEIAHFINVTMPPFNDDFGNLFADSANLMLQQHRTSHTCVICMTLDAIHVYKSCGHLVSCVQCCDHAMVSKAGQCPICRTVSEKTIAIANVGHPDCFVCKTQKAAKIFIDCGHFAVCEECEVASCPVCNKVSEELKVFIN